MCDAAPGIIDLLDRMGVPFNRTPEGYSIFAALGGHSTTVPHSPALPRPATSVCAGRTGPPLRVRSKVKKYEHWEFLSAVLDGNRVCRGICAMDLRSMEVRTFLPTQSSSPPAALERSSGSPRTPWSAPGRRSRLCISRAAITPTASSFRFIRLPSPARTNFDDV